MITELKNQFMTPGNEYTPVPFWFWNDDLNETEILRQIRDFKDKGVMGFVIHPRIGIPKEIEYLSDRYMELVKTAVVEAKNLGMIVFLYDEAMYPSGSAHGMVVKSDPKFASRGLKMVEYKCEGPSEINIELEESESIVSVLAAERTGEKSVRRDSIRKLELSGNVVRFTPSSEGSWSVLAFVDTLTNGTIRGIHFGEDDRQPEAPRASDLLNPEAIQTFLKLTHQRYYDCLKEYFGSTIKAIFTDEPSITGRASKRGVIAWTTNFLDWYKKHENDELDLPAMWFDVGEDTGKLRRSYKQAINKMMEITYYAPISKWCREHGIALAGHPEASDDIGMLKYFQIPGQDVVWRWVAPEDGKGVNGRHSTMAKCSSDAARHAGKRRNANECFGCCGRDGKLWVFTVDDMKWYLDWLFVRGVNLLYPHAFYYSIRGEKRAGERPPDVGPNNLWWPYYNKISDYIKRMCWLMTDCTNVTPVAVLGEEDYLPWEIAKPLYESQIEFNYLEDNLLMNGDCSIRDGKISIGAQNYSVLLIEDMERVPAAAAAKIQQFIDQGGHVIVVNPEGRDTGLKGARSIGTLEHLAGAVGEAVRLDVVAAEPCSGLRVSHVVKDGTHFYVLVNEGEESIDTVLRVGTTGFAEQWNGWEGSARPAAVLGAEDGTMRVAVSLGRRESCILCIDPSREPAVCADDTAADYCAFKQLDSGWTLEGPDFNRKLEAFESWTQLENMEDFSGTMVYEVRFELNETDKDGSVRLNLGEVYEMAKVQVNGKDAGMRMWGPFTFDISDLLAAGSNTIRVEVINCIANRMIKAKLKSGLLGPVVLEKVCTK